MRQRITLPGGLDMRQQVWRPILRECASCWSACPTSKSKESATGPDGCGSRLLHVHRGPHVPVAVGVLGVTATSMSNWSTCCDSDDEHASCGRSGDGAARTRRAHQRRSDGAVAGKSLAQYASAGPSPCEFLGVVFDSENQCLKSICDRQALTATRPGRLTRRDDFD